MDTPYTTLLTMDQGLPFRMEVLRHSTSATIPNAPPTICDTCLLYTSILEDVGYMARIAFSMDRIFRKFGLSGKSFIPMLIGTGCGVPGVMASRTIENDRDRKMTILTTTFIPCGAKMPIIGLIAGALFHNCLLYTSRCV